jgi:hypothetical protein
MRVIEGGCGTRFSHQAFACLWQSSFGQQLDRD